MSSTILLTINNFLQDSNTNALFNAKIVLKSINNSNKYFIIINDQKCTYDSINQNIISLSSIPSFNYNTTDISSGTITYAINNTSLDVILNLNINPDENYTANYNLIINNLFI